jgi:hypothetical protein
VAISAETPLHHPLSDFALAHMTHIERFLSTESTESTGNHIPNGSQSQTCSKSSRSLTTYTSISRQVVTVIMWNMMKYVNTRFKCWCFSHVFTRFHTFSHVFTHEMYEIYEMAGWPTKGSPMCLNAETTHDLALRGASDLLTAEASTHNGLWSGESSLSGWTKYHWKYPLVMTNIAIENDH